MARKQVSIQDSVETDEEFEAYLQAHAHQLICIEVYSDFCGPCIATNNAIRKGKLDIGQEEISMVKALADNIDALARFRDKSEPVFLFVVRGKLTQAMFGANGIELCRIIEDELNLMIRERTTGAFRPQYEITDLLPEEAAKQQVSLKLEEESREVENRLRVLTLAARKRRVCERLARRVTQLNFILFWPHCHHAHFDLYEKWDQIDVSVAAKEEIQLTEEVAREALYMSDVEPNAACLHALTAGEALVVMFKMSESDGRNFVSNEELNIECTPPEILIEAQNASNSLLTLKSKDKYMLSYTNFIQWKNSKNANSLSENVFMAYFNEVEKFIKEAPDCQYLATKLMRYALYEDIPVPKEDTPPEKQLPPIPAYERYASISKTAREVRRDRYNAMLQRQQAEKEEQDRLAAEQARLVREAEEERLLEEKTRREEEKMARMAAGLPGTPPPEPVPEGEESELVEGEEIEAMLEEPGMGVGTEEEKVVLEEQEEVFHSEVSVEGEDYIPPGGLFVPGLYTPPNDLAKANALALFFPKNVKAMAGELETEILPQHVLVMFNVEKRADVMEIIAPIRNEILNLGVFVGDDLNSMEHLAYTVKQYNTMERARRMRDRLVLMVSRKRSYPLLQLAGLNPCYISSDAASGERECLQLFPVGYGDDYEEEESIVEEEEVQVLPPAPSAPEHPPENAAPKEGDEDDDD